MATQYVRLNAINGENGVAQRGRNLLVRLDDIASVQEEYDGHATILMASGIYFTVWQEFTTVQGIMQHFWEG